MEQDQVGPHGKPTKVLFEVPKNMKGKGELKNILVEQDVPQIVQSTEVSTLVLEQLQPQEPINTNIARYMIIQTLFQFVDYGTTTPTQSLFQKKVIMVI